VTTNDVETRAVAGGGCGGKQTIVVARQRTDIPGLSFGPDRQNKDVVMDSSALRAMQAPLKERYKSDPQSAYITLTAKGSLDEAHIACRVETGSPAVPAQKYIFGEMVHPIKRVADDFASVQ
jgi:hypothetical protein